MSRIVSVWLPRWPILRFLAAQAHTPTSATPVDPDQPFVLAVAATGGPRIAALNEAAEAAGLAVGDLLADARAKAAIIAGARRRSRRRRRRPAHAWRCGPRATRRPSRPGARRTAPTASSSTSPAPRISSAARRCCSPILRGGSTHFGLPARLAIADTPGAAWALSRFHPAAAVDPAVRAGSRRRCAACPSRRCASRPRPARHCAGSASSASARSSTSRARPLPRASSRVSQAPRPGARPRARAARPHRRAAGLSQPALSARADLHARRPSSRSRPA